MFTYDEVTRIIEKELGGDRLVETYFLASVLSGNPERHQEASLKIVAMGHEYGGRSTGRPIDENNRVPFQKKEIEKIGRDHSNIHIQALSLLYSIIIQSPIAEMSELCQKSVCHLFDVGYQIGIQPLEESEEEVVSEPATVDSGEEDDSINDFLRGLL